MLTLPRFRFRRASAATADDRAIAGGALTDVPLSNVRRLCLPPLRTSDGILRQPPDDTALQMSLELAYLTYTLDLAPWMRSGWTDISIQVDNRLQSGVTVSESESAGSERIRRLMNAFKVARARQELKERNPLSQMMGALRQREKSDTIKAVTMLHPTGDGRYLVAIGFMGTGSRFYDWFSNFRFDTEAGFHRGFYQLTCYFEQNAERIQFPDTAAALGLSRLTLADVLEEMAKPHSRFSLWMAGHSQGAAVMQIFCHRLLTDRSVLPQYLVGYGFASPTVSAGRNPRDPADYPLYHLVNTDDMVPRIGSLNHLGLGLEYRANDALRSTAYGWVDSPEEKERLDIAQTLLRPVKDTPTMLEALTALMETISEEKTEESINALVEKPWSIAPLDKAFNFAGGKAKSSMERSVRYMRLAYRSLTGYRMSTEKVAALKEEYRPLVKTLPLRALIGAMTDRLHPPHRLQRPQGQPGAYEYIVKNGSACLHPFVWHTAPGYCPIRAESAGCVSFLRHGDRPLPLPHIPTSRSARSRGFGARRQRRSRMQILHSAP